MTVQLLKSSYGPIAGAITIYSHGCMFYPLNIAIDWQYMLICCWL